MMQISSKRIRVITVSSANMTLPEFQPNRAIATAQDLQALWLQTASGHRPDGVQMAFSRTPLLYGHGK